MGAVFPTSQRQSNQQVAKENGEWRWPPPIPARLAVQVVCLRLTGRWQETGDWGLQEESGS